MRNVLAALGLAAAVGAACCQTAGAAPASATGVQQAAAAASALQSAQYAERRTRHGIVKCYREFVVGPYRCHVYSGPF